LKTKLRAVALNGYLKQKKKFDEDLEKEIRALNQKYEKLAMPLYEKVNNLLKLKDKLIKITKRAQKLFQAELLKKKNYSN